MFHLFSTDIMDIFRIFQVFFFFLDLSVPGERALQQDEPRAATIKVISPTAKVPCGSATTATLLEKTTA